MNDQCPECESDLGPHATSCRCGWTLPKVPVPQQTREGLEAEDMAARTARARVWMAERGIADRLPGESSEDFRKRTLAWLKANALKIGKRAA